METLGHLAAIWRYPVKSLAGESLNEARVDIDGLNGDRTRALSVVSGHARAGKPYRGKEHNLLHTTNEVGRALEMAASRGVALQLDSELGKRYFDAASVSLIFDTWIAQVESALGMQLDPRRWRPNLYARAACGFSVPEADLVGSTISTGTVILRVCDTIKRCVTPTYDIAGGESNA
ncbi:MAG TPA: MOSC N-terminal beta barrel domain-containing protein, partial [Candidatus Baltobacteraceae bacterium]|nr:MOSC N-terminal beta barrel domain-containing protein [Candidatus Baltobacteraceae bacterium]